MKGLQARSKLVVTEMGWQNNTSGGQAYSNNLDISFSEITSLSYIQRIFWFAVQDVPESNLHYGLYDGSGNTYPSLATYQRYNVVSAPPTTTPSSTTTVPMQVTNDGHNLFINSTRGAGSLSSPILRLARPVQPLLPPTRSLAQKCFARAFRAIPTAHCREKSWWRWTYRKTML